MLRSAWTAAMLGASDAVAGGVMSRESTLSPAQLRALFPAVSRTSYLNAAASSPLARPVERAVVEHYRELAEWGDVGLAAWVKRKEEIRRQVATFIGATPEEVAFVSSTSMGMHVVGSMLKELGVREVVTPAGEFPSTTVPLLHQGLKLRLVSPRPDGSYPVEDIARAVRRTTGALVASAVQYSSGFRLDLGAAAKLCKSHRLLFAVNGAQALGQVPIDVAKDQIDFLCGTSHKWLMAGHGVGLFFARKKLLRATRRPFAGWLSVQNAMAMDPLAGAKVTRKAKSVVASGDVRLRAEASALEPGATGFGPLFGLGAALDLHARLGHDVVRRQIGLLQGKLRTRLRGLGFSPTAPEDEESRTGICSFPVHGRPEDVVRELGKKGVLVSARAGLVRVSTHVFNSEEDVDQLFWALEHLGVLPGGGARVRVG